MASQRSRSAVRAVSMRFKLLYTRVYTILLFNSRAHNLHWGSYKSYWSSSCEMVHIVYARGQFIMQLDALSQMLVALLRCWIYVKCYVGGWAKGYEERGKRGSPIGTRYIVYRGIYMPESELYMRILSSCAPRCIIYYIAPLSLLFFAAHFFYCVVLCKK